MLREASHQAGRDGSPSPPQGMLGALIAQHPRGGFSSGESASRRLRTKEPTPKPHGPRGCGEAACPFRNEPPLFAVDGLGEFAKEAWIAALLEDVAGDDHGGPEPCSFADGFGSAEPTADDEVHSPFGEDAPDHLDGNRLLGSRAGFQVDPPHAHHARGPDVVEDAFVVVAVERGEEILLARSPHFPRGIYSVLAGFVEPGESAEECVRREVHEETGVHVTDVRYFASQPWPFPHSLMLGFTARYAGGTVRPAAGEIEDAAFFHVDALPKTFAGRTSISQWLLEDFRRRLGRG